MKAVFESDRAYLQISKEEVMHSSPVRSEPYTYYAESGVKVRGKSEVVGIGFNIQQRYPESYLFQEGEKHNRLTLTDPEEIAGMRAAIEARDYIREISCEE